ncbi:MAG: CotH kinase family protein [Candidatus Marinimicrobia bacterium]|nr:CotH kinase family protein [Candidatus Neomarinimicrobiota bacterium]
MTLNKFIVFFLGSFVLINSINSQGFYDINTINTIEITFVESNWDQILDQLYAAGDEERLVGTALINGVQFNSVGVRYKGNSSYRPNQIKNPLNIKLDHIINDQELDGYGTLKLANAFKDPSFVREVLSYEIAREYFPASQANFANVYINGTHLGLYTSDQSVDKFFMRTHFGSDENTRVKGEITSVGGPPTGGVWQYLGQDSSSYLGLYDMKSDYGWSELINFLDTLNNQNASVDQVLNIDRHLWFLAFSNLFVNLDGPINNPQNYYLYKDDTGRFNPIPWDLNESFGVFSHHQTLGPLNTYGLQSLNPFANLNESEFPVISEILNNDTYRKMYVAHMKTMIKENFANDWYETRALEIQDIIAADVQADQNKFYSYSDFIDNVYNQIGGGGPPGPGNQSIIGIVQLMDARVDYLLGLSEFQYDSPQISNVFYSPENVSSSDEIWFSVEVSNVNDVFLAYRSNPYGVFDKINMYDDGDHGDGQEGDGVYGISIIAGPTDIQYYIYAENSNAVTFLPANAEYEFYDINVETGNTSDIVINEFLAASESCCGNDIFNGNSEDFVELYNIGTEPININEWGFSDTDGLIKTIAPDTSIASGEFLVLWYTGDNNGFPEVNKKLSSNGETIYIADANGNPIISYNFGSQTDDVSFGRIPDGSDEWIFMNPTPGTANAEELNIDYDKTIPDQYILFQNYPNPFNPTTTIEFSIPQTEFVTVKVFNIVGLEITTLINDELSTGNHSIQWDGSRQPSGLYFVQIESGSFIVTKKMVLLK